MAHVNPNGRRGPRDNVVKGRFGSVDSASATSQTPAPAAGGELDTAVAANPAQLGAFLEQLIGQVRAVSAYIFDPRMAPATSQGLLENMQRLQASSHALSQRLQTASADDNALLALRRDIENFGSEVQNFVQASMAAYEELGGALPLPPGPEGATGGAAKPFPIGLAIGGGLGVLFVGGVIWAALSSKPARTGNAGKRESFEPPPRVKLKRMRKARPAP